MHDCNDEVVQLRRRIAELEARNHGEISGTARENEKRYRTLFETMAQGVVYQAADGRITSANPAAERILGLSLDQMQGRTSLDPRWRAIHEDGSDFPGEQHPAMAALRTGRPVHNTLMGVFHPLRDEYRWILVDAVPEFLPGETAAYQVYATFTDITERRNAEQELRNRTDALTMMLEVSRSLAASLEPKTVLQAATDGITRLSGLDSAAVYLLDGDLLRLGATTPPLPPDFPEELRIAPLADHPHIGRAVMSGKPVFVPDLAQAELTPAERSVVEQRGLRTALFLPLISGEKTIGVLIVNSVGLSREWSAAVLDLCRTLANLAALAVENARLYDSIQRHTAALEQQVVERKHAEMALRQSEEMLTLSLQAAKAGAWEWEMATNRAVWSHENYRVLGLEPGSVEPRYEVWLACVHPDDRARVTDHLADIIRRRASLDMEFRVVHPDGSVHWIQDRGEYIFAADGGATGMRGIQMDITARKQAEESLRLSEQKYRTLFNSAIDAIYILDLEGRFIDANETGHARLGYSKQELLSLQVSDLDAPEFAARIGERIDHIIRQGAAIFESVHVRKDGTTMPVEVNAQALEYEGKSVFFSVVRDITDRKRSEEALLSAKAYAENLIETANAIVIGLDVNGKVTVANRAAEEITGYSRSELLGRNWFDLLVPKERYPHVWAEFERLTANGLPRNFENPIVTKTGDERYIVWQNNEVREHGVITGTISFGIDVTDRKEAEQERLELERRLLHGQKLESLGVLAGGIAHDFNNLLMAILGNLDLALRSISPVSPARANIEQSAQAARRAADLTRQMLAYSGKGRFVLKPLDVSELVEENVHLLRASITRTAVLDLHLDRSLPPIEADPGQVQQVIMNLIINASEAIGDEPGRITITTGVRDCDARCLQQSRLGSTPAPGRFVVLEVSDTGCGMDADTQERLFDPFFSTKALGRGLGMPAILGIVRGHRGALFVESTPGEGTTIRILFPELASQQVVQEAPSAAAGEVRPLAGTVLVVDDEEMVRKVCSAMVQSLGAQVLTAVDGREAVDLFANKAAEISYVILDLTMPNMDGMTAYQELARIKPDVNVIFSSGYDERESIQRILGSDRVRFIQKPYTLDSLRAALNRQ